MDYSLGEAIKSIKLTQWALQNRKYAINTSGKTIIIPALKSNIKADEIAVIERFLKLIGSDINEVNNFGFANYQGLVFKRHSPCYFCNFGEDNQMGLVFGGEDETANMYPLFIPCEVELEDIDGEMVATYTLGGRKIVLKEALDQTGNPTGKAYLKIETPNGRDSYSFPLLATKEAYADINTMFANWDTGDFTESLKNFGDRSMGGYGDFGNMFSAAFVSGSFPSESVVLFLKNGRITRREPDAQYKDGITSSEWVVVASSHPDLTVARYRKQNPTDAHKTPEYMVLENFQFLNCTKAAQPTQFLLNEKIESYTGYALLVTYGINGNTNNPMHTPSHAFITSPSDFDMVDLGQFPHLLEVIEKHVVMDSTPVKATAQLMPSKEPEVSDYDMAKADLANDFPPSAGTVTNGNKRQQAATNRGTSAKNVAVKSARAVEMAKKMDNF